MVSEKNAQMKCSKCGFKNSAAGKYCSNCGSKLRTSELEVKFDFYSLFLIHLTGSLYVLFSILANELVRATILILIPYLISGILGLFSAYQFFYWKNVKRKSLTKIVSVITVIVGFGITFILFFLGLSLSGAIGPGWVIFLINGVQLWVNRKEF